MLIKKMFVLLLIIFFMLTNVPRINAFNDFNDSSKKNVIFKNFTENIDLVLRSSKVQRVIVKFSNPSVVKHQKISVKYLQDEFLTSIPNSVDYKVLGQWQSAYNGAALEIKGYDLGMLSKNPFIEFIYSDNEEFFPVRDIVIQTVKRNEIEHLKTKYDNLPIYPTSDIKIGIVDSGIDYNHPDFYPTGFKKTGSKVMGGWDCFYTQSDEEDSDGDKERPGDPDPMDDSKYTRGHGTHVSGIAAGNNPEDPLLQGICPDATLFAYKVFPSKVSGGAPSYTIITACELAMKDKCSVINMSLGHDGEVPSEDEDSPYFDAFTNATKAGVMIVASAGNDGGRTENNLWPIHAPGVFDGVFQVGASDERLLQPFSICYPTNRNTIYGFQSRFSPPFDDSFDGLDIVECGFGSQEELSQVDVIDKIALIQRGPRDEGISFHDKNLNAKKAGAKACIIFNYDNRSFSPSLSIDGAANPYLEEFIPCMMVSFETQELLQHVANGFGYIDFKEKQTQIASYTSSGPCFSFNDGFFKPEICAPGTAIYSSIPTLDEKIEGPLWAKKQGTSMATPVVTGCAALLRYKYPDLSISEIQYLMMNTSTILYNPLTDEAFPFFYQGAGEVNLKSAFESPLLTNPGYSIVDKKDLDNAIELSLKNIYNTPISVSLSTEVLSKKDQNGSYIGVFDKPFITIGPNSSETVKCWLYKNGDSNDSLTQGVIWIDILPSQEYGINQQKIHVPFIVKNSEVMKPLPPISNCSFSLEQLDMEKENFGFLNFTLNVGTTYRKVDVDENNKRTIQSEAVRNYADTVYIDIIDSLGNPIDSIFFGENIPIGNYTYFWDGLDDYKRDFLPDGDYSFIVSISAFEDIYNTSTDEDGKVTKIKKGRVSTKIKSDKCSFNLMNSTLPPFATVLVCTPKMVEVNTEFETEIKILNPYKGKIDITLTVDNRLTLTSFIEASISSINIQNITKEIRIQATIPENAGKYISLGQLFFKTTIQSPEIVFEPSFSIKGSIAYPYQTKNPKVKIYLPTITTKPFLTGDFNNSGKIDKEDIQLFQLNLGRFEGMDSWNPVYDCFQDGIINVKDEFLVAKKMN